MSRARWNMYELANQSARVVALAAAKDLDRTELDLGLRQCNPGRSRALLEKQFGLAR
jgi:hypothetical protein